MYIKKPTEKKLISFGLFAKFYFYITIIGLIFSIIFISQTGLWEKNKKNFLERFYFNGINNYSKAFSIINTARKKFTFNYKEIEINIPYENVLTLEKNRKNLIDTSIEGGSKRDQSVNFATTSATLQYKNNNYRVSIRLKGDRTAHFREKNKSSYKIEIKGDDRLDGMKKFSFIKPRLRNYIHEWLFHELSSDRDLIKLNYEFIYLSINGSRQGLYVLEENFDKELIERNKRRNGPIFTLLSEYSMNIYETKLEVYNERFWNRSENLEILDFAKKKIINFLKGDLKLEETFDIKKWAWLFAVTDLTYTFHGTDPNNVKFFYNPVSGLTEPIPYDGHRVNKNFNKNLSNFENKINFEMAQECLLNEIICKQNNPASFWKLNFFYNKDKSLNKKFYTEYITALNTISDENYLSEFFSQRKENIERINAAIYTDYFFVDNLPYDKYGPGIYYFSLEDTFHRAKFIRNKIKPLLNKIYVTDNSNDLIVENNSITNHQLYISKITCNKFNSSSITKVSLELEKAIGFKEKIILEKNPKLKNTKCDQIEFKDKKGNLFFKTVVFSPSLNLNKNESGNYLEYFKFENNKLSLIKDEIIVRENIFIPPNFKVEIKSNQKIILLNNAFIHSKSPWKVGDKNGEVLITGKPNNFGGGIFITGSKITSEFTNTKFSYLSGLEKNQFYDDKFNQNIKISTTYDGNGINKYSYSEKKILKKNYQFLDGKILFGSLNFYNTKAILTNCKFFRIDSEDALNFISSFYNVKNTSFEEVSGDAIDIDFGEGEITNSIFTNIGNDGVDLSGTLSNLKNLEFNNVVDKIVSVGENSDVKATNILGKNAFIGFASKDGSKILIENINFNTVEFPFASYIKKKSYKAGLINISGKLALKKYSSIAIKDMDSEILINGLSNGIIKKDIINLIYNRNLQ